MLEIGYILEVQCNIPNVYYCGFEGKYISAYVVAGNEMVIPKVAFL